MNTQVETMRREAILVEDAASIRVMGFSVLEALPSRSVPYERSTHSSFFTKRGCACRTWRTSTPGIPTGGLITSGT